MIIAFQALLLFVILISFMALEGEKDKGYRDTLSKVWIVATITFVVSITI